MDQLTPASLTPPATDLQSATAPAVPAASDYNEDGVDLTLVRWMLSKTPTERLQVAQDFIDFAGSVRRAGTP